jgi:thiamine-phosphate pyrophosphorylase
MIRCYVTDRRRADVATCASRAVRAGIDIIQIREKDLPARELYDLVCRIRDLASGSKTRILVNDRLDVALAAGIEGVHLPGNGLPPARVRHLVKLLGVSVHTVQEAINAEAARADFVVFGPVFDSPGKSAVGLEPLRQAATAVRIPVLAIGGITDANAAEAVGAGAAGVAAIRLFQSP